MDLETLRENVIAAGLENRRKLLDNKEKGAGFAGDGRGRRGFIRNEKPASKKIGGSIHPESKRRKTHLPPCG